MTAPGPPRSVRRDRLGLAGYGCLAALALVGGLGGGGLLLAGVGLYVGATGRRLESVREASELAGTLERAVALCGFGALLLLVGVVAVVVLLKELGDDAARAERGPVRE